MIQDFYVNLTAGQYAKLQEALPNFPSIRIEEKHASDMAATIRVFYDEKKPDDLLRLGLYEKPKH